VRERNPIFWEMMDMSHWQHPDDTDKRLIIGFEPETLLYSPLDLLAHTEQGTKPLMPLRVLIRKMRRSDRHEQNIVQLLPLLNLYANYGFHAVTYALPAWFETSSALQQISDAYDAGVFKPNFIVAGTVYDLVLDYDNF
jgi:hypothetical protein